MRNDGIRMDVAESLWTLLSPLTLNSCLVYLVDDSDERVEGAIGAIDRRPVVAPIECLDAHRGASPSTLSSY